MKRIIRWLSIIFNVMALVVILASSAAQGDAAQTAILAMIGLSVASFQLWRLTDG